MKQLVKKLLIRLLEKVNFQHLMNVIYEKQHQRFINQNAITDGAFFYPESQVSNARDRGDIVVGAGTHVRGSLHVFKYGGKITIGKNCYIGDHSRIWSGQEVTIGDYVQIAHNVNIIDTSAHETDALERAERFVDLVNNGGWAEKGNVKTAPIHIGSYAWISLNATVLRGVSIGEGAIVGANALVTKDVPAYTLVAGNPAVIIKVLTRNEHTHRRC